VLVSIPAMIVILGAAQCGTPYLFQCMGKGILPELMDNYASRLFARDLKPFETLAWAETISTRTIGAAGLILLAAMVMLPRGLEDPVTDAVGKPMPVPVAQLKDWFASRLKRFELLSVVISLALVAGIAQMNAWMRWPQAIMNERVLVGGGTVASLKGNYEAMTDSVLQFSAVWYGLMVAALIFATRAVLARKCRDLAAEIVAYPGRSRGRTEADRRDVRGGEPAGLFRALPDVPARARAGDRAAAVGGGGEVGLYRRQRSPLTLRRLRFDRVIRQHIAARQHDTHHASLADEVAGHIAIEGRLHQSGLEAIELDAGVT
jgi:hypothetical protein